MRGYLRFVARWVSISEDFTSVISNSGKQSMLMPNIITNIYAIGNSKAANVNAE